MWRGKYTFPAALFLPGTLTLGHDILCLCHSERSEESPGRVVFFGLNITDNIKSAGFAFPGDPSLRSG